MESAIENTFSETTEQERKKWRPHAAEIRICVSRLFIGEYLIVGTWLHFLRAYYGARERRITWPGALSHMRVKWKNFRSQPLWSFVYSLDEYTKQHRSWVYISLIMYYSSVHFVPLHVCIILYRFWVLTHMRILKSLCCRVECISHKRKYIWILLRYAKFRWDEIVCWL